jgi:glutamyl-tRNA reductase
VLQSLSFHVVGVSHHTAGVEVRERFAFTPAELVALLAAERPAGSAFLPLATCNRCELYWTGEHDLERWFRGVARERGVTQPEAIYRLDNAAAVRHVFTVTAGLDSQVLGETEILGQVRRAYDSARAAGLTTRELDIVFSAALAAGRRVRHETLLGRHPSSVSSAAIGLVAGRWGGIAGREVVVLGAGEAAEGSLRALHEQGATRVTLINRHPERGRTLAAAWGAATAPWAELDAALAAADLLVAATGAARPVVAAERLERALGARRGGPLVILDLSVPRNVEPAARGLAGVELFDLDDLQRLCCPAAAAPAAALADAERVLAEELARLDLTLCRRAASPHLAELHRLGAELARQEAAWALDQLDGLTEREREVVREMADRLVRRVLYPVSRSLPSVDLELLS